MLEGVVSYVPQIRHDPWSMGDTCHVTSRPEGSLRYECVFLGHEFLIRSETMNS